MNGSLKQIENEGKNTYVHSALIDVGYTNLHACFQKQTIVDGNSEDHKYTQTEEEILRFLQSHST